MPDDFTFVTSTLEDGNMSDRFDVSETIARNRARFLARVHAETKRLAVMHVMHGNTIVRIDGTDVPQTPIVAEALMTNDASHALFLLTADCLPVAYVDRAHGAFALAHLGWRPAAKGLARAVVEAMCVAYGTESSDLVVSIGPGIAAASYAMETVDQQGEAWHPFIMRGVDGLMHVDLKGFVRAELVRAGVRPDAVIVHEADTCADPMYFSHYRSRTAGSSEGRMASILLYR